MQISTLTISCGLLNLPVMQVHPSEGIPRDFHAAAWNTGGELTKLLSLFLKSTALSRLALLPAWAYCHKQETPFLSVFVQKNSACVISQLTENPGGLGWLSQSWGCCTSRSQVRELSLEANVEIRNKTERGLYRRPETFPTLSLSYPGVMSTSFEAMLVHGKMASAHTSLSGSPLSRISPSYSWNRKLSSELFHPCSLWGERVL